MAARCVLTDLLVESCGHCNGAEARAAGEAAASRPSGTGPGPWFEAAHPGRCAGCEAPFDAGILIRADGEGGYLAEACGESA